MGEAPSWKLDWGNEQATCTAWPNMTTQRQKLDVAKRHLERVLGSWDPPDWPVLSMFGFYALEAAVEAAALRHGLETRRAHWAKAEAAERLHREFGLPNVSELLRDLNEARKSEAYGDVVAPELDAEQVVARIETYIEAVEALVEGADA